MPFVYGCTNTAGYVVPKILGIRKDNKLSVCANAQPLTAYTNSVDVRVGPVDASKFAANGHVFMVLVVVAGAKAERVGGWHVFNTVLLLLLEPIALYVRPPHVANENNIARASRPVGPNFVRDREVFFAQSSFEGRGYDVVPRRPCAASRS